MTKPTPCGETPFRINFEQQKKRAKELLKAFRENDHSAIARFQKHYPHFHPEEAVKQQTIKLSDSQLVIARELGLPSWAKLKTHIASMNQENDAITTQTTAPDTELKTLHIRCGTDLATTLPAAGFKGDFLEYSDPYGQGPIIQDENFFYTRAKFLYESYGELMEINQHDTQASLENADEKLKQARQQYERVVLWFEHDSYDQLILAKLLAFLSENITTKNQTQAVLEMVTLNHFPGSARFIGMGQLPPEAIRLLWQQRKPVTQEQLALGKKIWPALADSTPLALYKIYQSKVINHLPNMKGAILRHFQELPSTLNGLSLTEQITLDILSQESMTAGQLFGHLMRNRDPLPWLGDVMYWHILQSMTQTSQVVFKISKEDSTKPWPKRFLTLTETGRNVIANKQDWLTLSPPERWWGGLKIAVGNSCWRWDHQQCQPVFG